MIRYLLALFLCFLFVPSLSASVIVDNGDGGTSFVGSWAVSGATGYYGTSSLYNRVEGSSYTFAADANGTQEICLWWTEWPSRATQVQVEISDGDTLLDTVSINQRINGGQWNYLGVYVFTGRAKVKIKAVAHSSVSADAVKFTAAGDCKVTLTWDPPQNVPNIKGYQVYYGLASRNTEGFVSYDYSVFAGDVTTYLIVGLKSNFTYYFAVTTMDNSGQESDYSNEPFCFVVGPNHLPGKPTNLTVYCSSDQQETNFSDSQE